MTGGSNVISSRRSGRRWRNERPFDLAATVTDPASLMQSTGVTSAGWEDRVNRPVVKSGFRLECKMLPEIPLSGRVGYSFVVNSSIRLSPGRARVLEVFLMLQTRYCPLQMGRASLTPGWLALALVLSGCGTQRRRVLPGPGQGRPGAT